MAWLVREVVMGVVVAILASAAAWYLVDWHRHTCPDCSHTWSHAGATTGLRVGPHTCSECGRVRTVPDKH